MLTASLLNRCPAPIGRCPVQATLLWSLWQALLRPFRYSFTEPGWRHFVEWITGLALNVEEHTVTQSLLALLRPDDWKALETFVETGHWNQPLLEFCFARLLDSAPGQRWYGYCVSALDDTKVHRSSANVWGTCTFHEYTARCPGSRHYRASPQPGRPGRGCWPNLKGPAWFLPQAGRLYFRRSQLPSTPVAEVFHTKCELAVELFRQQAEDVPGLHLAVFDGGFAFRSVVRPLAIPEPGYPRIDFLTRLRRTMPVCTACHPEDPGRPSRRGRNPSGDRRLPPPRQGGRWPGQGQEGRSVSSTGRSRMVRLKRAVCLWRVLGSELPGQGGGGRGRGVQETVPAGQFQLRGISVALHAVELFAARFRQEDGFRDLKQRLGWEECRAWTKNPIERTTQFATFVTMSLLRLLDVPSMRRGQTDCGTAPPWNPQYRTPQCVGCGTLVPSARRGNMTTCVGVADRQRKIRQAEEVRASLCDPSASGWHPRREKWPICSGWLPCRVDNMSIVLN